MSGIFVILLILMIVIITEFKFKFQVRGLITICTITGILFIFAIYIAIFPKYYLNNVEGEYLYKITYKLYLPGFENINLVPKEIKYKTKNIKMNKGNKK